MAERTALDELSDLLDELHMTGIQRHWADEYLRDIGTDRRSFARLEREIEELNEQVEALEEEMRLNY